VAKFKATKEQRRQQIALVMEWLTEGWSRQEIIQEANQLWGYSLENPRVVDDLIGRARKEFVKQWETVDRKEIVSQSLSRFDKLFKLGIQQRQLAVSHAAETARNKLLGLDRLV
jgi:hypothetical protein